MDFHSINWGADEAKGDPKLAEYFVDIPTMQDVINGNFRYIIGRKGSGKSAIAEKIRIDSKNKHNWFYEDVSLKDFPLSDFRDLGDNSYRDKSKFVDAWKFVICMFAAKLLTTDMSCEDQAPMRQLSNFLTTNFPGLDVGISKCITTLSERKLKVSIKDFIGFEQGKSQSATTDVHFSLATRSIIDSIKNISTSNTYYIFFDELDEGYTTRDKNLRLVLLALLRAVEVMSKEFETIGINIRPILLLRSDIFERLHDNDLNKLDDYIVRLDWSEFSGTDCKLIDIVNARIKASLGVKYQWDDVVNDADPELPPSVQTVWKYILNRTYERPRDIIKFMKNGKLDFEAVKKAEINYSDWLFRELKDEMCAHIDCYTDAVMTISTIGKSSFLYGDIQKALKENSSVERFCALKQTTEEEIIKMMFEFSILGTIDKDGTWIFKYKDANLPFNKNAIMILHYGLIKKMRVRFKSPASLYPSLRQSLQGDGAGSS